MEPPSDPIAAVSHPDPWPYYADLAGRRPHRDERLGVWVVAAPADVESVLAHPAARVRPAGQLVPDHLAGTRLGEAFSRMARMSDGALHRARRDEVAAAIAAIGDEAVADACRGTAERLGGARLDDWVTRFAPGVIARLVGLTEDPQEAAALATGLARCFGPDGGEEPKAEVDRLQQAVEPLGPIAVALLFQSCDAMAGMIGQRLAGEVGPAVHNTRRYAADAQQLPGGLVPAGAAVLVVLAASGHELGAGPHRCPGGDLAALITDHVVGRLGAGHTPVGYRPSPNVRIPVFGEKGPHHR